MKTPSWEVEAILKPIYLGVVEVEFPSGDVDVDRWIECFEEAKLKAPDGAFVVLRRDRGLPLCFMAYRKPTIEEQEQRREKIAREKRAAARAAVKNLNQRASDLELMQDLAQRYPDLVHPYLVGSGLR